MKKSKILCIAILLCLFCSACGTARIDSENLPELPTVNTEEGARPAGTGPVYAYDISELVNANPWTPDAELETLPVYKNTIVYNENYEVTNLDTEGMETRIFEIAEALGLETEGLEIREIFPYSMVVEQNGISINVGTDLSASVYFDPEIALPEKYKLSDFSDSITYEELLKTADYLKKEYSFLPGMKKSKTEVYGGSYDPVKFTERYYGIGFFAKGKTLEERIVNYNFNRITFGGENGLGSIRMHRTDLSEKMGDYPLITVDEARQILLEGRFLTISSVTEPAEENIRGVELRYKTGPYMEYYMPYYVFYIENPEKAQNGLKAYEEYYVPAINEKYLERKMHPLER